MDDTSLITRVKAGDMMAARALYQAHAGHVYRLIFRMTGEDSLAEDCLQETFLRVYRRLGDYRAEAALGTWIRRVAVNVTLNVLRSANRHWKREVHMEAVPGQVEVASARSNSAGMESDPHLRQRIRAAIDELPEQQRLVFVMYDMEGYSHEEIGLILGITRGASKVRLARARSRLREALASVADRRQG